MTKKKNNNKKFQMNTKLDYENYDYLKKHDLYGIKCVKYAIRKHKEEKIASCNYSRQQEIEAKMDELNSKIDEYHLLILGCETALERYAKELEDIRSVPERIIHNIEQDVDAIYNRFVEVVIKDNPEQDTSLASFFEYMWSDIMVLTVDYSEYKISEEDIVEIYTNFYNSAGIDDISFVDQLVES